jgi:transposase
MGFMGVQGRYPDEVRERAVRLVFEQQDGYDSQWEAIVSVAAKIGCSSETLRKWIRAAERAQDPRPAGAVDAERMKGLERENRELRRANEILRKAAAFFAQAELDRPRK